MKGNDSPTRKFSSNCKKQLWLVLSWLCIPFPYRRLLNTEHRTPCVHNQLHLLSRNWNHCSIASSQAIILDSSWMRDAEMHYTVDGEFLQKPRKRKNGGWGKWACAIILALLFVYRSARPVMRLRADPPPSFYDYSLTWSKKQRQHERHLAQAYWRVAVQRIQTYYSPGKPLPATPPPQFRIGEAAKGPKADIVASRIHYWYRLREVWSQRDSWSVSYKWNTAWVDNSLNSLDQDAPQWVSNGFHAAVNWVNLIAQRITSS